MTEVARFRCVSLFNFFFISHANFISNVAFKKDYIFSFFKSIIKDCQILTSDKLEGVCDQKFSPEIANVRERVLKISNSMREKSV